MPMLIYAMMFMRTRRDAYLRDAYACRMMSDAYADAMRRHADATRCFTRC
jgi:hypothetical protein